MAGGAGTNAKAVLTHMQEYGNVDDDPLTAGTQLASYKIIIGTQEQRVANLQQAIRRIMQSGISVTLIR